MAGETAEDNTTEDMELFTVSLSEGEHIQRLDLCTGGFIEKLGFTTNKGKVFGPWGCEGGCEGNAHRYTRRRGVNPQHVYLDGIRGNVVRTQGAKAINRVSFKWSFVMDKMVSAQSYYHPLTAPLPVPELTGWKPEKISVLDLEKDINLSEEPLNLSVPTPANRRDWDWPPMAVWDW